MTDLDRLSRIVPAPDAPVRPAAADLSLPADYQALIARYGVGNLAGLRLLGPADIPQQATRQRSALEALIEAGIELPYAPADLLPWGIDEAGNVVWWLTRGDWPVVANEARGEAWHRHDGGAVSFLVALLSGAEHSDFLVIEGDDFEPYDSGPVS